MDLKVLKYKAFDDANALLWTEASIDPFTSKVSIQLRYDSTELLDEQVEAIRGYYLNAFSQLISDPTAKINVKGLIN